MANLTVLSLENHHYHNDRTKEAPSLIQTGAATSLTSQQLELQFQFSISHQDA